MKHPVISIRLMETTGLESAGPLPAEPEPGTDPEAASSWRLRLWYRRHVSQGRVSAPIIQPGHFSGGLKTTSPLQDRPRVVSTSGWRGKKPFSSRIPHWIRVP